jgi:hypothetical protein
LNTVRLTLRYENFDPNRSNPIKPAFATATPSPLSINKLVKILTGYLTLSIGVSQIKDDYVFINTISLNVGTPGKSSSVAHHPVMISRRSMP